MRTQFRRRDSFIAGAPVGFSDVSWVPSEQGHPGLGWTQDDVGRAAWRWIFQLNLYYVAQICCCVDQSVRDE